MLPKHGKIECRSCFTSEKSDHISPHPKWQMINDPGAWGGENPKYLVLGFSKGATQAGIFSKGKFEDVAFAGMRGRLTQALLAMNLISKNETSDQKINDPESNIAFGSLIRCSVSRVDENLSKKTGKDVYGCTGALINKSFIEIPDVIRTCASNYLKNIPNSVEAVFLLGNSDQYVKNCQALIHKLFPIDFENINPMAVRADGRLWIHLAHPSRTNGHFNNWLNSSQGSGIKRIQAKNALQTKS